MATNKGKAHKPKKGHPWRKNVIMKSEGKSSILGHENISKLAGVHQRLTNTMPERNYGQTY